MWKQVRNPIREIEIRKEFVCQQGHDSKVLVIYCISIESKSMDIKSVELNSGVKIMQSMFRLKENSKVN